MFERLLSDRAENSIMQTITIAVSAILIAAGLLTAPGLINNARDNNIRTDLANLAYAQEAAMADSARYYTGVPGGVPDSLHDAVATFMESGGLKYTLSKGADSDAYEMRTCEEDGRWHYLLIGESDSGKVFFRADGSGLTSIYLQQLNIADCIDLTGLIDLGLPEDGIALPPPSDPLAVELARCMADEPASDAILVANEAEIVAAFASAGPTTNVRLTGDITINNAGGPGLTVPAGRTVRLDLNGHDLVVTGTAGIFVTGTSAHLYVIDSAIGGTINATGTNGSGIGGPQSNAAGYIHIECGTITAKGGNASAGIGAGRGSTSRNIEISGGVIRAESTNIASGESGTGIGGSYHSSNTSIVTISGGIITAIAGDPTNNRAQDIGSAGTSSSSSGRSNAASGPTFTGGKINGIPYPIVNNTAQYELSAAPSDRDRRIISEQSPSRFSAVYYTVVSDFTNITTADFGFMPNQMDYTLDLNGHDIVVQGRGGVHVSQNYNAVFLDSKGGGSLTATATDRNYAGIGGGNVSGGTGAGNITINSGTYNVTSGPGSAAIGAGESKSYKNITINGGTINATAIYSVAYPNRSGSAIGPGISGTLLSGGVIAFNGGTVTAQAASKFAYDIGRGASSYADTLYSMLPNASITFNGGRVNDVVYPLADSTFTWNVNSGSDIVRLIEIAYEQQIPHVVYRFTSDFTRNTGTSSTALILNPDQISTIEMNGHNLVFNGRAGIEVPTSATLNIRDSAGGGSLTATAASNGGAGIGREYQADYKYVGRINIYSGTINATGMAGGAGIGAGRAHGFTEINIYGGNITANATGHATAYYGVKSGAGIGDGYESKAQGVVNIYGGTITASAEGQGVPGIGGASVGEYNYLVSTVTVNHYGGTIN